MSILVFGGTTEGKRVAKLLSSHGLHYVYSTKTCIAFENDEYGEYRYGALNTKELIDFCTWKKIQFIIHAAHPFATLLNDSIIEATKYIAVTVIKFERMFESRDSDPLVNYIETYEKGIDFLLENKIAPLLALTGVQTINKLRRYWMEHPAYFRILPRDSSVTAAIQAGFPESHLLPGMAENNVDWLKSNIIALKIHAMITKESGTSGFLTSKIMAAKECHIPILIVMRPEPTPEFISVNTEEELLFQLNRNFDGLVTSA